MDWQAAFNIAFALAGFLGGWVLKMLHSEIQDIKNRHSELQVELPATYARRDDVKDRFDTVVRILERIEDKVERQKL